MDCTTTTEILSAALDGEAAEAERLAAEEHLEGCPDCLRWYEAVANITRSVRIMPVEPGPDVTDSALAAWRPRLLDRLRGHEGRWVRTVLRVLLAVVASTQFAMAVAQVAGAGVNVQADPAAGGPMPHVAHETGAWNAAIAVALGWIAFRARHAGAHLPVLLAFTGTLTALSALDLFAGHVGMARVLSHLPVLLGLVLVAVLAVLRDEEDSPGVPQAGRPDALEHGSGQVASPVVSGSVPPPVAYRRSA